MESTVFHSDPHASARIQIGTFDTENKSTPNSPNAKTVSTGASDPNNPSDDTNLEWLNAYNAPHMVNIYAALPVPSNRFTNGQGSGHEYYSTSWTYDLLTAWRQTQVRLNNLTPAQQSTVLVSNNIRVNALTNPPAIPKTNGGLLHATGGHSILMGLDLGFKSEGQTGSFSDQTMFSSSANSQTGPDIGVVGVPFSRGFSVSGNPGSTYSVTPGTLPPGLTLNPSTGMVTGIPTQPGSFTGTVIAITGANTSVVTPFAIGISTNSGWSVQNALTWSSLLPTNGGNNQQGALRNFLSLYNLTISDGNPGNNNGSWEELNLVNGDAARKALFGGGTQDTSLIQHVFVGDGPTSLGPANHNSLPLIRTVVNALGIKVGPSNAHENHFHVDMRTPTRVEITNNLSTASGTDSATDIVSSATVPDVASFIDQFKSDLDLQPGDVIMFSVDVPDLPPPYASVLVAQSNQVTMAAARKERAAGICYAIDYNSTPNENSSFLSPHTVAVDYFKRFEKREVAAPQPTDIELITQPRHGKVVYQIYQDGLSYPVYIPDSRYVGDEKLVFRAKVDGTTIRLVYLLKVTDQGADLEGKQDFLCKKTGNFWKIAFNPTNDPSSGQSVTQSPVQLISSVIGLDDISLKISNLAAGTIGQALDHSITLDDNAAGHGWFIDTTPGDNEECLPTSNPNEWVARPGIAAEGKMDMRSVLMHEYGHVLGLEHSGDGHDVMAAVLQPGVRRIWSAQDMADLRSMLGMNSVAGLLRSIPSAPTNDGPNRDSDAPLPTGGSSSSTRLGRARNSRFDALNDANDTFEARNTLPQYDIAANATLSNLDTSNGWLTRGNVSVAGGVAILSEVSNTQTRLNQVFMVGPNDRYLTFTVNSAVLDDQTNGPDDAFEVGLLNANTGASLAGPIGLTHSDALLNLQADGSEFAATGVSHVTNPDGSRTYLVDLSGIASGTAVNLSFDLIGFAQNSSRVTLRDVRLVGNAETRDDSISTSEDTLVEIAALANDIVAAQAGFVPVVVTNAAHGQVVVNANGTFSYTPANDYFGADSFTYQLSNGAVNSNTSTVSINVTAVNDAPIAADVNVTTAEDTSLRLDLVAQAHDVDSTTLTARIVSGPLNGTLTANADGSFTYNPGADFNGTDRVTFKVNDGQLDSNLAMVNITVTPVNDAAVAANDSATLDEDTVARIDVLANDHDIDNTNTEGLGQSVRFCYACSKRYSPCALYGCLALVAFHNS